MLLFLVPFHGYAKSQYVTVYTGQSAKHVCQTLAQNHLFKSQLLCQLYFYVTNRDDKIKAGEYLFNSNSSWWAIVRDLVQGNVARFKWIIREGDNIDVVLSSLKSNKRIKNTKLMLLLNVLGFDSFAGLQGKLYPDTYYFTTGEIDADLIMRAYKKMLAVTNKSWKNREAGLPIKSLDEAIIIASMVEMESAKKNEKSLISSVIYNRLSIGMPLQIDATVQYGLRKKEPIVISDTKIDTPYNTYLHKGLPPGPICFPGIDSLEASLHPIKTQYFYYVLNSKGYHSFSKSYQGHLNNIKLKGVH